MFATELTLSKEELDRVFADVSRLKTLYAIWQLRGSQGFYDWFTETIQRILNVPASALWLIAERRLYYESQVGIEPKLDLLELESALLRLAVDQDEPLTLSDTQEIPQLTGLELHVERVRACLSMPIILRDGMRLGALSAIDYSPRRWDSEDSAVVRELSQLIAGEFEMRAVVWIEPARKPELNDLRRRIDALIETLDLKQPKTEFLAQFRDARQFYGL